MTLLFGAALIVGVMLIKRLIWNDAYLPVVWIQLDRLAILAWAALILLSAMSVGSMLLRRLNLRPAGHLAAALFGTGLGLGVISLVTLLLGLTGFLGRIRMVVALLALLFLGLPDLGTLLRMARLAMPRARKAGGFRIALWAVLGVFLLMNVTRAFDPPYDYDSLEYHLAAPAAYHEARRVFFMRDNVYANFPQNVEMLYLAAFELTESRYRGVQLGQLLGALMGFLAALALREMVRGVSGKEAGDIAAAVFYVWPGVTLYSGVAYVELPLIFYATLAFWGLLWSWRRKLTRPKPRGWIVLSGIATGLALGVKYTAALFLFVPILIWLVALGLRQRLTLKEIATRGAAFGLAALICFSPWLVRNAVNTRNPVYPLLYKVFDGENWDAQRDARWTKAHSPSDVSFPRAGEMAREAVFVNDYKVSLMALLFLPFVLLARRREREPAAWLLLNAALLFLLWFYFTQQNLRFLEIAVTVAIGLAAVGAARATALGGFPIRTLIVLLLFLAPPRWVNYMYVEQSLGVALGKQSRDDYFAKDAPDFQTGYSAMQVINQQPENAKVIFLGEARAFYCERDHVAATVFDVNPLQELFASASSAEEVRARMAERGITHLYADTAELARLQRSYAYSYDGREYLGLLDGFDWALFDDFIRSRTELVWSLPAEGVGEFPWVRWPEMLAWGGRTPRIIAIYRIK
jgi:hypothetical protein